MGICCPPRGKCRKFSRTVFPPRSIFLAIRPPSACWVDGRGRWEGWTGRREELAPVTEKMDHSPGSLSSLRKRFDGQHVRLDFDLLSDFAAWDVDDRDRLLSVDPEPELGRFGHGGKAHVERRWRWGTEGRGKDWRAKGYVDHLTILIHASRRSLAVRWRGSRDKERSSIGERRGRDQAELDLRQILAPKDKVELAYRFRFPPSPIRQASGPRRRGRRSASSSCILPSPRESDTAPVGWRGGGCSGWMLDE